MPNDDNWQPSPATSPPHLWAKLKRLARQMRHDPTPAENRLWECLRNRRIAHAKFRRQHAIERFVVDFYCAEAHLVVEVDGLIHDYTPDEDAIRQEFLESLGLRVIRFSNDDVLHHLDAVMATIHSLITPISQVSPETITDEQNRSPLT